MPGYRYPGTGTGTCTGTGYLYEVLLSSSVEVVGWYPVPVQVWSMEDTW